MSPRIFRSNGYRIDEAQLRRFRDESLARAIELRSGGSLRVAYIEPQGEEAPFFSVRLAVEEDELSPVVPADDPDVPCKLCIALNELSKRYLAAAQVLREIMEEGDE